MARRGAVFVSLFFPLLLCFLLSPSLFVRAAVPGVSCHGHGVLILHGRELSWVGLVWSGRAGWAPPPSYTTAVLSRASAIWQRGVIRHWQVMISLSRVAAASGLSRRGEPCRWRFQMGRPFGMGEPGPWPSDGCSRAVKVSGGRGEVEKRPLRIQGLHGAGGRDIGCGVVTDNEDQTEHTGKMLYPSMANA